MSFLKRLQHGMELRSVPAAFGKVEERSPPDSAWATTERSIEGRVRHQHPQAGVQEHKRFPNCFDNGGAIVSKQSGGSVITYPMICCGEE